MPSLSQHQPPLAIVVMGVAGSGKTIVGEGLSSRLSLPFLDGDRFHPPANIAKMSAGTPLVDADRWPWLDAIGHALGEAARTSGGAIAACSALKRAYRQRLTAAARLPLVFVFLNGSRETLAARLAERKNHFMPKSLLDSQLATLERPGADEPVVHVSFEPPPAAVIDAAAAGLTAFSPNRRPADSPASPVD